MDKLKRIHQYLHKRWTEEKDFGAYLAMQKVAWLRTEYTEIGDE